MALQLKDRIWTEVDSSGTDDLIIGAVKEGYSGWETIGIGSTVYYCLVDDVYWEVGHGEYVEFNGKRQITRNVLASNVNGKINISSSRSATVFCTYPAEKSVYLDLDNNIDLPNSDALLKYIAGIQVTAPAVITEALIVDGVAGADGDLAGLLNVYRKDEIDEQQEKQDIQIEENKQDIIELEEEIEALAPTFDRGQWDYEAPSNPLGSPAEGTYFTLNENEVISTDFADTAEIIFHNKDVLEAMHTWAGVEAGQYIELFDTIDSEFLLAEIDEVTLETGYVKFAVTPKQSEGGPSGMAVEDEGHHRVRIKIFELPEADVTTLMPKAGGTFTGTVKHKKNIEIEPTMPSRFVTVKNFYSTNADGSSAGTGGTNFGLNFDLDHGNTGYNTVKWTTRDGDILKVNGGEDAAVKYTGKITDPKHIVNQEYIVPRFGGTFTGSIMTEGGNVLIKSNNKNSGTSFRVINGNDVEQLKIDGYGNFEYKRPKGTQSSVDTVARLQDMQTLHSNGNSLRWSSSAGTLSEGYFSTATSSLSSNKKWYFRNLYDYTGGKVNVRDYDALQGCMLEIWKSNTLIVKTVIKNWLNSDRDAYSVMFETSGYKNTVYASTNLNTTDIYSAIITNLRKK